MKKTNLLLALALSVLATAGMVSCSNDGPDKTAEVKFQANLSGSEEVPPVQTSATGRFEGVYNKETKILTYTITYSGLTPIAGHLHNNDSFKNGPVVVDFGTALGSPISGTKPLTQALENELFMGRLYANLHTAANRGGEIRGQVIPSYLINK
jgi:CHRD domain